jgi:hypothetical protein
VSDADRSAPPAGWNRSLPEHLPEPTIAPGLFAFGVMLLGWGLVSSPPVTLVGGVVLFVALVEWIREVWHDAK